MLRPLNVCQDKLALRLSSSILLIFFHSAHSYPFKKLNQEVGSIFVVLMLAGLWWFCIWFSCQIWPFMMICENILITILHYLTIEATLIFPYSYLAHNPSFLWLMEYVQKVWIWENLSQIVLRIPFSSLKWFGLYSHFLIIRPFHKISWIFHTICHLIGVVSLRLNAILLTNFQTDFFALVFKYGESGNVIHPLRE